MEKNNDIKETTTTKFWNKVSQCKHKETDNYLVSVYCDTPYCHGHEYHCKLCGVYVSECGCGSNSGLSGWSHKRWINHEKRIRRKISQKISKDIC